MRSFPHSTKMDQQGRIFIGTTMRRKLGLFNGGPVEFNITEYGQVTIKKSGPRPKKKLPKK